MGAPADRGDDGVRGIGNTATFDGASGPAGAGGTPLRLYHGIRDDIGAFDLSYPNRKTRTLATAEWMGVRSSASVRKPTRSRRVHRANCPLGLSGLSVQRIFQLPHSIFHRWANILLQHQSLDVFLEPVKQR